MKLLLLLIPFLEFHRPSAERGGAALHGITMFDWGLDDEAGLLTEAAQRNVMADEKWIKNSQGEVVAGSIYNVRAEFNFGGYISGATITGLAANAPGAVMTVVFPEVTEQGVATGVLLCRTNNIKKVGEDFVHCDTTGFQFPGILS